MRKLQNSNPQITRRRWLQQGTGGVLGIGMLPPGSIQSAERSPRANACVFLFLFGGPSHIDLWDMKPEAPSQVRGEFRPVATRVPGMDLCEHLPLLAKHADKFCLLRSMTHDMRVHGPACSEVYSGRPYFGPPVTDQATPQDWPSLASLVTRFGLQRRGLPNSVVLPWYTQFVGQDRRIAGQSGGRMGEEFNPFLVQGDPMERDFHVAGLTLPDGVSRERFQRRGLLRQQLESVEQNSSLTTGQPASFEGHVRKAVEMLSMPSVGAAFDLRPEPATLRERYGQTKIGQSLLLARRLVEAGVSLVTVNWDDIHKADKVSPHWDTHAENFPKLKDRLCPPFDRAVAMFLDDLHQRGLLETTLVVALGEFGRTPKVGMFSQNGMTKPTGRDHWPHAFTVLLAGGGIRGGQVYGSTVANGGYVKDRPVSPADLTATVLSHLGIDADRHYDDRFLQIRQALCEGKPIDGLS
jgi:hypothetical protein